MREFKLPLRIGLTLLALSSVFSATAAFAGEHSVSAEAESVLESKAWYQARSLAMSQVPQGAKNVRAGYPSCTKDGAGFYKCEVVVTYETDDD